MTLNENALEAAVEAFIATDAHTRYVDSETQECIAAAITAYLSALPGENKELIAEAREFVSEGEGWGGRVLSDWDFWRAKITNGDTSDAPRVWFESVLDSYGERIERLAAALEAADAKVATLERELRYQIEHRDANRRRAEAAESRADRLAAEVERLREALQLLHDNIVTAFPSLANLGPVTNARAALTAPAPGGERWRHKKRGTTYTIVGKGELQMSEELVDGAPLVIYRGENGQLWARAEFEFYDGRFERVPASPRHGGE